MSFSVSLECITPNRINELQVEFDMRGQFSTCLERIPTNSVAGRQWFESTVAKFVFSILAKPVTFPLLFF